MSSEEMGTAKAAKPFIAKNAKFLHRREGGGSLMHWPSHVAAFYASWGRRYLEPRDSPWKTALDTWVADHYSMGRGALVAKIRSSDFVSERIPQSAPYIRRCMKEFELLNICQDVSQPSRSLIAEPFWNSHWFDVKLDFQRMLAWRNNLQVDHIFDTVRDDGRRFSTEEWKEWAYQLAPSHIRDKPAVLGSPTRVTPELLVGKGNKFSLSNLLRV